MFTPRPPATGLTTAKWLEIEPSYVYLPLTLPTQGTNPCWVARKRLDRESSHIGDPYPHVVVVDGLMLVEDGHHRRQAALDDGELWMLMRVHTLLPARCWRSPGQVHHDSICDCLLRC